MGRIIAEPGSPRKPAHQLSNCNASGIGRSFAGCFGRFRLPRRYSRKLINISQNTMCNSHKEALQENLNDPLRRCKKGPMPMADSCKIGTSESIATSRNSPAAICICSFRDTAWRATILSDRTQGGPAKMFGRYYDIRFGTSCIIRRK